MAYPDNEDMKILLLVNWKINRLIRDNDQIQPPDKFIYGQPYWFFRFWPLPYPEIDIIDITSRSILKQIEKNVLKFYVYQALRAFLPSFRYDIIISHGAQSALVLSLLRTLSGQRNPPHVIIDPGCFNGARDNKGETALIRYATRSAAGIIYHARIQAEYYERNIPDIASNCVFIPFGTDPDYFPVANGYTEDYIISFGSIKRDYQTLIKAWQLLNPSPCKLVIVGVKNLASFGLSRISESIVCYPRVSVAVLKSMISRARFVVIPLPIYNYSYGQMSLLQSMSMGKAVVVSNTPGVLDYVNDGHDAVLVTPNNIGQMADALRRMLRSPSMVTNIGRRARQSVVDHFNERVMSQRIYEYVKKIVEEKAAHHKR